MGRRRSGVRSPSRRVVAIRRGNLKCLDFWGWRDVSDDEVYQGERAHLDLSWPDQAVEEYSGRLSWEATAEEPDGLEFFLLSPTEFALHVELLAMVTNFHADAPYRLSVGRTMNIGRPWIEGLSADHLLVSLPYPYDPSFECCDLDGRQVRFLWLVPGWSR